MNKLPKLLSIFLLVLFAASNLNAQILLNGAESVAFDKLNNRYLVSSWFGEQIIQVDLEGNQILYRDSIRAYGNCIKNNILYVSGRTNVKGIDLSTDQIIMDERFPNALQLDGITTDNNNNLYVVETRNDQIHKLNLDNMSKSVVANLPMSNNPQDIIYDHIKNRLLVCFWAPASPIVEIDLSTGVVDTAVITRFGFFDGLSIDEDGNIYASSHDNGGTVLLFDNDFTNGGHVIYNGITECAGLDVNWKDNILAIPSFVDNYVKFIPLPAVYLNINISSNVTTGHAPLDVSFTGEYTSGSSNLSFEWDFNNDGIIDSYEQNPNYTFTEVGSYSVKLVVKADTLEKEILKENFINTFDGHSALDFKEVKSSVIIDPSPSIEFGEAWTFECWIKPHSLENRRILTKKSLSVFPSKINFTVFNKNSLALIFKLNNGSNVTISTPEDSFIKEVWQHVAITYSFASKKFAVLINGTPQIEISDGHELFSDSLKTNLNEELIIGNMQPLGAGFDGIIDEVRFWNIQKSNASIKNLMGTTLIGNETNLTGYWRFNEGTGQIAEDLTSFQNHGTILSANFVQSLDFSTITSVENNNNNFTQLKNFVLHQNYPNPFNPTTTIKYSVPEESHVSLTIFNALGMEVKTLVNENKQAGNYTEEFDARGLSSGVYFYKINGQNFSQTKKMIVLK